MKEDTKIVHAGRAPAAHHGAVNVPVYHLSTVIYPSMAELRRITSASEKVVRYGRRGSPTSYSLEAAITELEEGFDCLVLPSGISAIATALLGFLETGDHLLMVDSAYAPTRDFCDLQLTRFGIETTYYDPRTSVDALASLFRDNTRMLFLESPGSYTFEVQDVPALARLAHDKGAVVAMDNTWATPLFFKPLRHGVDLSIQSATKYIGGHSDIMMGTITTTETHWPQLRRTVGLLGLCSGPDDVYLAQRGLRTMGVRLHRHMETGIKLAQWLLDRPEVTRVRHPALPQDPGHTLWQRDFAGASGLFGVELVPAAQDAVDRMLDGMEYFGIGYSWGGYESLIMLANIARARTATRWGPEGPVIRLHAGLEDPDDLMDDLDRGLRRLTG